MWKAEEKEAPSCYPVILFVAEYFWWIRLQSVAESQVNIDMGTGRGGGGSRHLRQGKINRRTGNSIGYDVVRLEAQTEFPLSICIYSVVSYFEPTSLVNFFFFSILSRMSYFIWPIVGHYPLQAVCCSN